MKTNRTLSIILTCMVMAWISHAGDGRIEINQSMMTSGFNIWNPGSYVVTENLMITNKSGSAAGISIQTSGVTIDMNGFALCGPGTNSSGSWSGIEASGLIDRVCIKNGIVEGFTSGGILLSGKRSTIRNVKVLRNKENGIHVADGLIIDCLSAENGKRGFELWGPVNIRNCVAIDNGWQGFYVYDTATIEGCVALENGAAGIHGRSGTILYSLSSGNADDGVLIDESGRIASIRGNVSSHNANFGFRLHTEALLNDNCAYNNKTNYYLTGSVTAGVNHYGP